MNNLKVIQIIKAMHPHLRFELAISEVSDISKADFEMIEHWCLYEDSQLGGILLDIQFNINSEFYSMICFKNKEKGLNSEKFSLLYDIYNQEKWVGGLGVMIPLAKIQIAS